MSVIIIGAGLGGLSLAQGLRRAGIPCQVYERDPSPEARLQGYRLHIGGVGDSALREVLTPELHELFRATAGRALPHTNVYDDQLRLVTRLEDEGVHLNVNRFTLRQILLHGQEVRYGKRFTHYETGDDGVTAHFADGTAARGSLLVGADGVNSPVRRQRLPHARVVDAGLVHLYGRIPLTPDTRRLLAPEMFAVFNMMLGPDRTMAGFAPVDYPEPVARACARLMPDLRLRDNEPYLTCSVGARWEVVGHSEAELAAMTPGELQKVALGLLAGWHPLATALVGHWDVPVTFPQPIRTSVPIGPWEPSRVTLAGDAIHAMSPAGGAGANTALRDGAVLASALAGAPPLEAVAAYESAMADYGFAAVRESAGNGRRFLGQNPLTAEV
ncbi:FAD-dependent oxidoreductase [Amycolatopsis australiensis]|uniref:2-polyprenyl-6-methoxyphenol hydroxylase n=1 Tax=Amycolatopsis australiensis TaxID=546364 RepID=A0A1K1T714_9PSEU|nr:NAD(P)/FAD-dependent oxidoreductase [Amycolatopsis australiensis]SFW92332.1 2-polyprenyl-6-methoxyphenol hydroxylase [Amycolatopsis australiensis]